MVLLLTKKSKTNLDNIQTCLSSMFHVDRVIRRCRHRFSSRQTVKSKKVDGTYHMCMKQLLHVTNINNYHTRASQVVLCLTMLNSIIDLVEFYNHDIKRRTSNRKFSCFLFFTIPKNTFDPCRPDEQSTHEYTTTAVK
jgi:hypothetical protein